MEDLEDTEDMDMEDLRIMADHMVTMGHRIITDLHTITMDRIVLAACAALFLKDITTNFRNFKWIYYF